MATPVALSLMPGSDLMAGASGLLKTWAAFVLVTHRRLFLFLGAAFLFHFSLLCLIRIDTTREHLRHRLRPVAVLETSAPTSQAHPLKTMEWDVLGDPRLFLFPQVKLKSSRVPNFLANLSSTVPGLSTTPLPLTAAPSYETIHPALESLEERLKKGLEPRRVPFSYRVPQLQIQPHPTWHWGGEFASRTPVLLPELASPVSNTILLPTRLRAALDASGTVTSVLLEQSCGKPELDQEAITALQKIRFLNLPAELTPGASDRTAWGVATLFWYSTPELQEQVLPTPP